MKKVIGITGSTGMVGKKLLSLINKNSYDINRFKGDIRSKSQVNIWVKNNRIDYLIHLAAIVPVSQVENNYKKSVMVNYNGTKNIINSINQNKPKFLKWLFYSSTAQIYKFSKKKIKESFPKSGTSKYGNIKLNAEKFIMNKIKKNRMVNVCIGRIFSVTSIDQSLEYFVPSIFKKIKKSKNIFSFPSLNKKRDFIHIEDLCRSIIHLMKLEYNGTLNIASGKSHSLNYIIKYFCKKFKKKLILIKNKMPNIDLTADIQKLKKTNFKHKKKIDDILQDYYYAKK